jgi:predicted ATPase
MSSRTAIPITPDDQLKGMEGGKVESEEVRTMATAIRKVQATFSDLLAHQQAVDASLKGEFGKKNARIVRDITELILDIQAEGRELLHVVRPPVRASFDLDAIAARVVARKPGS